MKQDSWNKVQGHEPFDDFFIMEVISETVEGLNVSNFEGDGIRSEFTGGQCKLSIDVSMLARRDLVFEILDTKNSLKVSARVFAVVNSGRSDCFPCPRSLSTVWKSFFL